VLIGCAHTGKHFLGCFWEENKKVAQWQSDWYLIFLAPLLACVRNDLVDDGMWAPSLLLVGGCARITHNGLAGGHIDKH
jgi:hypothetical protein